MVTMVPPDSGPRMGLSDSTEGFFGKKQRNTCSLGPGLELKLEEGTIFLLGAEVLFLGFAVPNALSGTETLSESLWACPGKAEGHVLELINSLGSLMLITLKGKQR